MLEWSFYCNFLSYCLVELLVVTSWSQYSSNGDSWNGRQPIHVNCWPCGWLGSSYSWTDWPVLYVFALSSLLLHSSYLTICSKFDRSDLLKVACLAQHGCVYSYGTPLTAAETGPFDRCSYSGSCSHPPSATSSLSFPYSSSSFFWWCPLGFLRTLNSLWIAGIAINFRTQQLSQVNCLGRA